MSNYTKFPEFDDYNKFNQEELSEAALSLQALQNKAFANEQLFLKKIKNIKTFEEVSDEIAMNTPWREDSIFHSKFQEQEEKEKYLVKLLSLMNKHCIEEFHYINKPKDSSSSHVTIHLKKEGEELKVYLTKVESKENNKTTARNIENNQNISISIIPDRYFSVKSSQNWIIVNNERGYSLPFDQAYYLQNIKQGNASSITSQELRQIYEDFSASEKNMPECFDTNSYEDLVNKVQEQLSKEFYKNVNVAVNLKLVDADGNTVNGKDKTLQTNANKPYDVKLNITLKPDATVEIKHIASENYMKQYVSKWQKEAEARGLEVDIESLRMQTALYFESKEIEASHYQKFIQKAKSLFNDKVVGYVEGIQVSQKIATNIWEHGTINESTWFTKAPEYKQWPKYAQIHPLVGGVTDGVVDEIVGIPVAVKGVYEIVTDDEKQEALKNIFTKEGAKQMFNGLVSNAKETLNDEDKSQHFAGQTVVSVATMLAGPGFLSKAGKIDEVTELGADLNKAIPNKETIEIVDKIKKTERHVDNDKILKELKQQIDEDLFDDIVKDASEEIVVQKKKLSFKELQAFWKRGNDFNKKSKDFEWYGNNEIWITHPTKVYPKEHKHSGKSRRFRLDSWDNNGDGMIVSRKATNLAEINKDTFIKYCKEISEKYPPGSKIANSEIGDKLYGKNYLEIPDANLTFDKIEEYKKIAKSLDVELIFKPE